MRYLLGQLGEVTVLVLSGGALGMIAEACSVARTLQPSVIVVEDVDLIAEQRELGMGVHPLLFQLLNEMDGLGEELDVTFLLTTNRADLLEPALAERPGRADHAARCPCPTPTPGSGCFTSTRASWCWTCLTRTRSSAGPKA